MKDQIVKRVLIIVIIVNGTVLVPSFINLLVSVFTGAVKLFV